MPQLKPWHEWNVPPPWVCAVIGIVIIGIFTGVMWQVSERKSAALKATLAPAVAPARQDPNDPDSF